MTMRYSPTEYHHVISVQQDVRQAQDDYQRLRGAWLDMERSDPDNEVALAMVGADMERAQWHLQALTGASQMPFTHEPTVLPLRQAQRTGGDNR